MPDVAAEVRDLRMRYGTVDVLDGIDFEIRTGEVAARRERAMLRAT
jgi:ABC-2 type transport system ATP-binding protein